MLIKTYNALYQVHKKFYANNYLYLHLNYSQLCASFHVFNVYGAVLLLLTETNTKNIKTLH